MSLRTTFEALAERFTVKDILPDGVTHVFILESPHTEELKYAAPVSGKSGTAMSKALFGEKGSKIPLGLLAKTNLTEEKHHPVLDRIGLMNVCSIPMQESAYDLPDTTDELSNLYAALEKFRGTTKLDTSGEIHELIMEKLEERLESLRGRPIQIIPCGVFAQTIMREVRPDPEWTLIYGIPHPSRNQWSQEKYQEVIQELVTLVLENKEAVKESDGIEFTPFDNEEVFLDKLKEWGVEAPSKRVLEEGFIYSGVYTDKPVHCLVVGYQNDGMSVVIRLEEGDLHAIHIRHLLEMQKSSQNRAEAQAGVEKQPSAFSFEGQWHHIKGTRTYVKMLRTEGGVVALYLDASLPETMCYQQVSEKEFHHARRGKMPFVIIDSSYVYHFGSTGGATEESIYDEEGCLVESKLRTVVLNAPENKEFGLITSDEFDAVWEDVKAMAAYPEIEIM